MFQNKKTPLLVVILFIIIGGLLFLRDFTLKNSNFSSELTDSPQVEKVIDDVSDSMPETLEVAPTTFKFTAQKDGQTAFELLQENAEIEFKEYDFGVFVESINGIKGDEQNFWALYINGEQSKTGAKETILAQGDLVEWKYEAVEIF